jgi:hypothetical protein
LTSQKRRSKRPTLGMRITKEQLQVGMVVEVEWTDVQAVDRITLQEIQAMPETGPTLTYGVVLKLNPNSVVIGHELGADDSDGNVASAYPFKLIDSVKLLARVDLAARLGVR